MGGSVGLERLDAAPVQEMVVRLEHRIAARFPDRGLAGVARDLTQMADEVADNALEAQRRLRSVRMVARAVILVVIVATVAVLVVALRDAVRAGGLSSFEWVPLIESIINDLVFAAIAVVFLYALPGRLAWARLLTQLHRLRSLAHIIDMHQLTKDPERLRPGFTPTAESVDPGLDRDDLERYLDYCSELLSLVAKVAALCAEESQDAVVLETVSTVETLTTGMSRKIWQKISLLPD
ncbi:MAG: hypothetical protein ACR2JD_05870 [Nocardioides sp.]